MLVNVYAKKVSVAHDVINVFLVITITPIVFHVTVRFLAVCRLFVMLAANVPAWIVLQENNAHCAVLAITTIQNVYVSINLTNY